MEKISDKKLLLKITNEYKNSHFTLTFAFVLAAIFLFNSYDFTSNSWDPLFTTLFTIYLFTGLLTFLIALKIKRDLFKYHEIQNNTRLFGIPLILTILVGNVFATSFSFQLLSKNKNPEYTFAVYAWITQVLIILVSSLNLFKQYVVDSFFLSMAIFVVLMLFYSFCMIAVSKLVTSESAPKWFITLGIIAMIPVLTGNIFAFLLGYSLILKARKKDKSVIDKWQNLWKKILNNSMALLGLLFVTFMFSISVVSSWTFDYDLATLNNYSAILQPPSLEYPLGTDNFGRDQFTRIIFGAQISLIVGFAATILPAIVGGFLGAISGFYGRTTDNIIMRLLDILYAVPGILLAIAIIAAFGANTVNLIIALSVGAIPTYARTMRANVIQISNYEFVEAAKVLGLSNTAIIFKHIVPNALAPMIVKATLTIGGAVISTSSLSFLGLGVEPHIPEWGNILQIGSTYLETHSYLAIFPGLSIILLVLSFNFLGDGLRDALDPKTH
ncbi:Peptide/nickel transport system permease protein OS=Ureibacillus acetophenoni OX=614649 GN=SAMN05877842_112116 PE=3 SV=1 [Ureibacillus acetophenoni]